MLETWPTQAVSTRDIMGSMSIPPSAGMPRAAISESMRRVDMERLYSSFSMPSSLLGVGVSVVVIGVLGK